MPRALPLACLLLLVAGNSRAIDESDAVAKRNFRLIIDKLDYGEWNDRIQAVHELEYMQEDGVYGLAIAAEDWDWQVRMTAVHALGAAGHWGVPILERLRLYESCPVVRLIVLHNLGSAGSDEEELKALNWVSQASTEDLNKCPDRKAPGKASWARKRRRPWPKAPLEDTPNAASRPAPAVASSPRRRPWGNPTRRAEPEPAGHDSNEVVVTRDPILPPKPAAPKPARAPETLPGPATYAPRPELDSLLDESTATVSRPGVVLEMTGRSTAAAESLPRPVTYVPSEHPAVAAPALAAKTARGKAPASAIPETRSTAAPESLPRPATYIPSEHEAVTAPGLVAETSRKKAPGGALPDAKKSAGAPENLPRPATYTPREPEAVAPEGAIVADKGAGKSAHDALPGLLRALKIGDIRTRARAADDLGHLGAKGTRAVPDLLAALRDVAPRVRSSAALALGNIGTAHEDAVPALVKALGDKSEDVRYSAAVALSRIDSPEARSAFERRVDQETRAVIEGRDKGKRKRATGAP